MCEDCREKLRNPHGTTEVSIKIGSDPVEQETFDGGHVTIGINTDTILTNGSPRVGGVVNSNVEGLLIIMGYLVNVLSSEYGIAAPLAMIKAVEASGMFGSEDVSPNRRSDGRALPDSLRLLGGGQGGEA